MSQFRYSEHYYEKRHKIHFQKEIGLWQWKSVSRAVKKSMRFLRALPSKPIRVKKMVVKIPPPRLLFCFWLHWALTLEFESDQKTHMIKKVNMRLTLPPNFPEKYTAAIVKAVDLCYVKKHLHEPPEFKTITQKAG
jgi:hypothetical protein